jgi:hypothetical protein
MEAFTKFGYSRGHLPVLDGFPSIRSDVFEKLRCVGEVRYTTYSEQIITAHPR